MICTISVRQAGGGTRYLALDEEDYAAWRSNHALLDSITPLACLDVDADGSWWTWPHGCANSAEGKAAIRAHRAWVAEEGDQ